ncbi:unnamed protein product [Closterium sp. NIES-54]
MSESQPLDHWDKRACRLFFLLESRPCCCRSSPCYCSYNPTGAATALAAAATALDAAATAPAAAAPAPSTAATSLVVQLQPLLLPLQPSLLPLQPLLLPLQPLLLQLQPGWCSYSPCCSCYSPCCCRYSLCCCRYSPGCCRSSPFYFSYSPAAAATALAAAATALAAAATAPAAAAPAPVTAATALLVQLQPLLLLLQPLLLPLQPLLLPQHALLLPLLHALLLLLSAAGSAGSAAGAGGAGGATRSAGGVAGAGGAGPTTDRHCLSWPLSRQLQQLGVDSGGHCLSWTTPPVSSFASGFFSEPIQVVEALFFYVLRRGGSRAAPLGASESAAALGASESATALGARASPATGPPSADALHTFTLDSGASRCFFRDCTSLTPLAAPVPDVWVDTFIPRGQRVANYTCSRTGRHLATFTRRPGSSLYTLTTASAQVAAAGQVAASSHVSVSGQLAASCSCWVLSHQTLLWHHRLGHPSLPCLRGMHSHLLVSGLPRSLPSLPRSPAPPCLPCVEGWQRAAPHSSESATSCWLLMTTHVTPLSSPCSGVLIPRIHATRRQLRVRFSHDFPVLRLHSDRGGGFSSDLLAEFCRDKGIVQSFTLMASPKQNGIAERRIFLIMEVARISMVHAAAPNFLWPFPVRYAAHQLNLWPHVSKPETSPTLRWTGKVGDASVFRVWGALSLVRNAKANKLSSRTLRCVFLGFPTDAPPWQFYHPCSRRVFSSQDVTFDDSVCYYTLHPHASHPVPLAPLFLVPVPPTVDPLPPQGPSPSGVSQVDLPPLVEPLEVSFDSSSPAEGGDPAAYDTAATRETPPGFPPRPSSPPPQPAAVDSGAETAGAESEGAELEGEGSGGAGSGGATTGVVGCWGAATGGAD